ncbi:Putative high-affinity ADP-ribose/NAD metabolite binding module containing protein [Giardia duodenalis]|uniref:Putative high-affinity ADP-ribose/NAD metabolite binding module containing protein n=1 Tax=Giardia intestinalis TaxID=5741 RepID=V6TC13_GIAIN|nr:Putative high-affinity ADP-ribose/NAD metabolite binding module containing protein [Giardia intestinalis]
MMGTFDTCYGDLLDYAAKGCFDVIVHGCNCFCTMSGGIAAPISSRFPAALKADSETAEGDRSKLGSYTSATVAIGSTTKTNRTALTVVNAYTQYMYRPTRETPIPCDYDAIDKVMARINQDFAGKSIGLPQLGAGLAGGDWKTIEEIIRKRLHSCHVTIVLFKASQTPSE